MYFYVQECTRMYKNVHIPKNSYAPQPLFRLLKSNAHSTRFATLGYKGKTQYNEYDIEIVIRDKGAKQYLYEVKFIDPKNKKAPGRV